MPERYAAVRDEIATLDGPLYGLIERRYGERVAEIGQEIASVKLDPAIARKLSAKKNAIGLKVKRSYLGKGSKPVCIGTNTYLADDFRIVMRLIHDEG